MRTLHHFWLLPACRAVRVALAEKGLEAELVLQRPWERSETLLGLNPAAELPVLVENGDTVICPGTAIYEFLDEAYPERSLIGGTVEQRAETRRIVSWFDDKFNREVTQNLVGEKLLKRMEGTGHPHAPAIRAGLANIHYHLDYIGFLMERRTWLAGDEFSMADIVAGAHLSAVDYLGDVPWEQHREARDWYARIKSRPSFRPLLNDTVPGMPASKDYANLDF